jgi:hypothetical protein
MFSNILFGQDAGKWKGYNYENKTAMPIMKPVETKPKADVKPSGYKNINASSLQFNRIN